MKAVIENFNIKQWFLISLLLRLIVMPFTMHGDIFHIYTAPHFLSHGKWDAYGIIVGQYGSNYYPPFAMIFFAFVQLIFKLLFPGFEEFAHTLGILGKKALYESEHLYLSLFLMKLPYLFFDCLLILTCWKMLPNDKSKFNFTVFWAVNPVIIYSTYMFGQFDLIPTFFVVLSCYFCLQEGKERFACLSIAAGTLFKVFPIVFLPIVILVASRNVKDFMRLSLYGIVPVLFLYGLFYLISGEVIFKLFYAISYTMEISFDLKLLILRLSQITVYLLICIHIVFFRKNPLNYLTLTQYFLAIYLAICWGFLMDEIHFLIWFLPFAILYIMHRTGWKKPFYFLLIIIFLEGAKSRTGSLGIFAPINPELFMSMPALKDITGFLFNLRIYDSILVLLFKGITVLWVFRIFKNLYTHDTQRSKDNPLFHADRV